jgi:Domain of unknown function (DUF305)
MPAFCISLNAGWRSNSLCNGLDRLRSLKLTSGKSAADFPKTFEEDHKMKAFLVFLIVITASLTLQGGSAPNGSAIPDNCAAELRAAMNRMHESMSHQPTAANADEDFVRLMVPHHQAALDMAKTQLLCGKDPQIRRLAQEIITDQQSEIQVMDLWLKNHATTAPRQNISHD